MLHENNAPQFINILEINGSFNHSFIQQYLSNTYFLQGIKIP